MYKTVHVLILFLALCPYAKSQHCSWDNCSIIIIDVRDSLTGEIINNLEITLTDSLGKPYTSQWNLDNYREYFIYQNTDTLRFGWNNKIAKSQTDNSPGAIPFAFNNYVLLVYPNNYPGFNRSGTDKILIEDIEGRYQSTSLLFDENKIVGMCTNAPIRRDEELLDDSTIHVKLRAIE